ncbi:MAG: M42 family metallopeptidase [Caldilineaceae bacterium]|nr:M42 family metallopeptidase [Caldilineaceae bacterium]MCB0141198.1 M42 family metallopeptidase [Caldilineaceae bacterium]
MELLKELCETPGIPGFEDRLRTIVRRELTPVVDEVRVDALGNLVAIKKQADAPKLMIAAHMDEIGFVVNYIDDQKGWLRLVGLGGHDPRNMVAQRVTVSTPACDLTGILYPGIKPPHIQTDEDRNKQPKVSDFFVDLGLPAAKVKELVPIGAFVTLQREFAEIGDCVSCKALDDRVALYVMIRAVQQATRFGFEVYAVATTQEEVGLRGATTSAFDVAPDVGIAIDVTLAADIPGIPEHERVTQVGAGTAIKLLDSSTISHPKLVAHLQKLANQRHIPWQHEILPRGGTDAGAMQRVRSGAPVGTISIPTRYIHSSVEMVSKADVQASVDLLTAFIEEGAQADLTLS